MAVDFLGGLSERALQQAIGAATLRQEVISENLANVDTPGYKRGEVRFEEMLARSLADTTGASLALARTNGRHLAPSGAAAIQQVVPEKYRVTNTQGRLDRNNVDIDSEMAKLAENSLLYTSLVQVLGRRMSMVRSAINEGRR